MVFCRILQYFVAKSVFFRFTLFCREICFGTIYVLLRGEKLSQKLGLWRKNMRYAPINTSVHTVHWSGVRPEKHLVFEL